MNTNSIFNLSPTEKLQLVTNLWGDLVATPNEIPIHGWQKEDHGWQKEDLQRRIANLKNTSISDLSWEAMKERIRSQHER